MNETPKAPRGQLTLLEVVLVLAILGGVVFLVVLPAMREAAIRRNEERGRWTIQTERAVKGSLITLVMAEEQYKATSGSGVFGTLAQMSGTIPFYIDPILGQGRKSGYCFVLTVGTPADSSWYCRAIPFLGDKPWKRRYFVDKTGIIRFNAIGLATSGDSSIE